MKIGEGQAAAQGAGKFSAASNGQAKKIDQQIKRLEDEKNKLRQSAQAEKGDKKAQIEKAMQQIDQQIQELRNQKSQIAKEGDKVKAQFNRPLADKQADENKKDKKEEERLGKYARDVDVMA